MYCASHAPLAIFIDSTLDQQAKRKGGTDYRRHHWLRTQFYFVIYKFAFWNTHIW